MTLLCFAVRRKTRESYPHTQGMMLIQSSSSPVLGPNLHFIERIGQGRFASVWKAKMGSELNAEIVAVKVFSTYPRGHLESFEHELSMYQTSELQHKNILRFAYIMCIVGHVICCYRSMGLWSYGNKMKLLYQLYTDPNVIAEAHALDIHVCCARILLPVMLAGQCTQSCKKLHVLLRFYDGLTIRLCSLAWPVLFFSPGLPCLLGVAWSTSVGDKMSR